MVTLHNLTHWIPFFCYILYLIFNNRHNQKRHNNGGGALQSILTVATSCGSSKTSLNSTKLSSSQKQIDSHLDSPSNSTHDNDADILHEYRVSHADNNTTINLDRYDLAVSKEKSRCKLWLLFWTWKFDTYLQR